jgi:two-component system sensor histidine kinase KdpD
MNAIRFSPNGKTVETGFSVMENQSISFFVKDDGPGVPVPLQQNIFDKYVQISDPRNNRNDYTTGLGLTFCKMAVEAHHGTIWVDSDGTAGSCFYFRIPFRKERS